MTSPSPLNGTNELDALRVENGALVLEQDLAQGETANLQIAFKSRGLAHWYFQIRQPREVRDFELLLNLPDLPKLKLNYPEGCMTPTEIKQTDDGHGCTLAYRLDHAICNKGMGIELQACRSPAKPRAWVLAEAEKGWVLLFAAVVLGLTLAGGRGAVLVGVLVGCSVALGYGLLGDLSDTFLGFWRTMIVILVPTLDRSRFVDVPSPCHTLEAKLVGASNSCSSGAATASCCLRRLSATPPPEHSLHLPGDGGVDDRATDGRSTSLHSCSAKIVRWRRLNSAS